MTPQNATGGAADEVSCLGVRCAFPGGDRNASICWQELYDDLQQQQFNWQSLHETLPLTFCRACALP
jgi:hypothetical protein